MAKLTKDTMLLPMLELGPAFRAAYRDWQADWKNDDDEDGPPVYLALHEFVRCTIKALEDRDSDLCKEIFSVVEEWHLKGDKFVREAANIGFLEGIQNTNLYRGSTISPQDFVKFLHPESLYWWKKVERFWLHGELIVDERLRARILRPVFRYFQLKEK